MSLFPEVCLRNGAEVRCATGEQWLKNIIAMVTVWSAGVIASVQDTLSFSSTSTLIEKPMYSHTETYRHLQKMYSDDTMVLWCYQMVIL